MMPSHPARRVAEILDQLPKEEAIQLLENLLAMYKIGPLVKTLIALPKEKNGEPVQ